MVCLLRSVRMRVRAALVLVLSLATLVSAGAQNAAQAGPHSPPIGRPAPEFTVQSLDGHAVSLADYRGKVVLVNFWATWCGNCKVEMPWLAQLREQYAGQGFEVLGILTHNASPDKIASITGKYGVRYPILMCNHKTAQAYGGIPDLPESFFIDREGRLVAAMSGADSKAEIETEIVRALRAK
jgi:peroxiredoxin